ncbi:MAG: adenosylmethionine decarboxylase [Deltaproteobacteria bacterium]|nr:adenosylmethionine decarboxylase [Deltaproteobacteria bacterium]MBK8239920.1 adenosylmethionine decarboxylase [Deltaproteobacteria bacterium]MBK8716094.1 adenosylmethionine decarboxylase [Deltaproteobacteria bacterium]MBP7286833.1 adenosylmethionine decarboxylase [Nannocystaceae bacterium]
MSIAGRHSMIELYGCPRALLDDLPRVRAAMLEAVTVSRGQLVGECSHRFSPHGVTMVGLLAESHISIHTWPEHGYAAADVFTCGEHGEPELACRRLAQLLAAERFELRTVDRGRPGGLEQPLSSPA